MSQTRLGHTLQYISKNRFFYQLADCLSGIDGDLSGENGPDFTRQEALDAGFDSTAGYIADLAVKAYGVSTEAIEHFINGTLGRDHFYEQVAYDIIEQPDVFIVSIAYMYNE